MSPESPHPDNAHAVRPKLSTRLAAVIAAAVRNRRPTAKPTDDPLDTLIAALSQRLRPEGFDMGATVVVSGRMIEPRVWVRIRIEGDLRTWSLTPIEAGVAAIRCRLEAPAVIGGRLADAFNHAILLAERRMEALNAASPTAEAL